MCNVTLGRIFTTEEQRVCICNLRYPSCNAHCHLQLLCLSPLSAPQRYHVVARTVAIGREEVDDSAHCKMDTALLHYRVVARLTVRYHDGQAVCVCLCVCVCVSVV